LNVHLRNRWTLQGAVDPFRPSDPAQLSSTLRSMLSTGSVLIVGALIACITIASYSLHAPRGIDGVDLGHQHRRVPLLAENVAVRPGGRPERAPRSRPWLRNAARIARTWLGVTERCRDPGGLNAQLQWRARVPHYREEKILGADATPIA
jgi:hypothetical protein